MAPIPTAFKLKKEKILSALAVPESVYTDASPKGSVDEGIRKLIDDMNQIEGIVTTSSCAGRISVFLEGLKCNEDDINRDNPGGQSSQVAVPGGKGKGGRWLFVSHDSIDEDCVSAMEALKEVLDFSGQELTSTNLDSRKTRFVKFQFEPMILHVMTASLQHAQSVLSAAINAGFRESGVQSLKNLDDPNAFPMVAIRSSGLAFGSLIGFVDEDNGGKIRNLVNESYLKILFNIANDRFQSNADRIHRFQNNLLQNFSKRSQPWEDEKSRKERKKAQGLEKQATQREQSGLSRVEYVEEPWEDRLSGGLAFDV